MQMEADWEIELGGDAPVIEAQWSGFVDLQRVPESIQQVAEAALFHPLAQTLSRLNSQESLVWTSKCDFWPQLASENFDPDELDAPPGRTAHATGCYIDLLPKSDQQWITPAMAAASCKTICTGLHAIPLHCCRLDLIVRRAFITPDLMDNGITAYLTACGPSPAAATHTLAAAVAAFADALCGHSKLQ